MRKKYGETSVGWMRISLYADPDMVDQRHTGGEWNPVDKSITVCTSESKMRQGDILLHELIHAVDYLYDLGLSERKVRILGTALQQGLSFIKRTKRK